MMMLSDDQRQYHAGFVARNQPYLQQLVEQNDNRHHIYFLFELSDPYARGWLERLYGALGDWHADDHEQMRSAQTRQAYSPALRQVIGIFLPKKDAMAWAERIGIKPERWPHQPEYLVISVANGCAACTRGRLSREE
jgi:hypothetical protein